MAKAKPTLSAPVADAYHGQGGSYVRQPGSQVRQRVNAPVAAPLPNLMPEKTPFADFPLSIAGGASTPKPQE